MQLKIYARFYKPLCRIFFCKEHGMEYFHSIDHRKPFQGIFCILKLNNLCNFLFLIVPIKFKGSEGIIFDGPIFLSVKCALLINDLKISFASATDFLNFSQKEPHLKISINFFDLQNKFFGPPLKILLCSQKGPKMPIYTLFTPSRKNRKFR
jgi:hypothetical protein